jgi:magnesium-transporting ATPase (P-type)
MCRDISGGASGEGELLQRCVGMPSDELDLTLVAVLGLEDPLREDVPQAIAQCNTAGQS